MMENSRKDRAGIRACVESVMTQNSVERINAYSLAVYMSERKVIIEDDDIFAGKICDANIKGMIPEFFEEIDSLNKRYGRTDLIDYIIDAERTGLFCRNAGDHFTPAYDELIENGIAVQIKNIGSSARNMQNWLGQKRMMIIKENLIFMRVN